MSITKSRFRVDAKFGIGVSDIRVALLIISVACAYLAGTLGKPWLGILAGTITYVCGALQIKWRGRQIWGGDGESGSEWALKIDQKEPQA